MIHHDGNIGRPPCKFVDPIRDGAERTKYEKGSIGALFTKESKERDELYGFAQTHLVSKNTIQTD